MNLPSEPANIVQREDKLIQTETKSEYFFGDVYDKYSSFKHLQFHPQIRKTTSRTEAFCSSQPSCSCIGCNLKIRLSASNQVRKSLFSTQQFQQNVTNIAPRYSSTLKELLDSPKKISVPYNTIYSDDDEIMEAANKFLRSVEKRKQNDEGSDLSSWESNRYARIGRSSDSTPCKEKVEDKMLQVTGDSSSLGVVEQMEKVENFVVKSDEVSDIFNQ